MSDLSVARLFVARDATIAWKNARPDDVLNDASAAFSSGKDVGSALGSVGGSLASAIAGGIGGALAAIISALYPDACIAWVDRWHQLCAGLSPVERLVLLSYTRLATNSARNTLGLPAFAAWKTGDGGPLFGYNCHQGVDVWAGVFAREIPFKFELPTPPSDTDPLALWMLAVMSAQYNDDQPLKDFRFFDGEHAGRTWDELYTRNRELTAGECRRRAIAAGIADLDALPITPQIAALLRSNAVRRGGK